MDRRSRISLYWYPIYAFVRHQRYNPQDAQDLTQGFFLHLLGHKALSQVSPLKGKFRSFLIASLQNYLSDQADSAHRLKRGGKLEFVPLNAESADDRYPLGALDLLTAEKIFDARWAMTLLDEAMGRLRQECAIQGNTCTFETLKPFLDPINSDILSLDSGGNYKGYIGDLCRMGILGEPDSELVDLLSAKAHRKTLGPSPDFSIPQIEAIGADARKIVRADLLWDAPR